MSFFHIIIFPCANIVFVLRPPPPPFPSPFYILVQCMSHNRDLKFVTSVVQSAISCLKYLFNLFVASGSGSSTTIYQRDIRFTEFGSWQLVIHVPWNKTGVPESKSRTRTRQTKNIIILNGNFLVCLVPVRLLLSVPRERLVQRARLSFVSRSYWLTHKFKLVTIG